MFIVKDTRKLNEILYDPGDKRASLKLSRREAQFLGDTTALCASEHGPQLTNVKQLILHNNKLVKLTNFSTLATNAKEIKEIDVSLNFLTELPSSLGRIASLEILCVEDNKLERFPAAVLPLHNLRVLRVSGNAIADIPARIGGLKGLQELAIDNQRPDASGARLTRLPDELCQLTSLRTLVLRGNAIEALPENIGALTSLQTLAISSNALTRLPESIGQCKALKTLIVNSNKLTSLPVSLAQLPALTKLNVGSNQLFYLPKPLLEAWGSFLPPELVEATPALEEGFRTYLQPRADGEEDGSGGSDTGASSGDVSMGAGASGSAAPGAKPAKLEIILDGNPMMRILKAAAAPPAPEGPLKAKLKAGSAAAPAPTAAASSAAALDAATAPVVELVRAAKRARTE